MAHVTIIRIVDPHGNHDLFRIPAATVKWADLDGFVQIEGDEGKRLVVHHKNIAWMSTEDE